MSIQERGACVAEQLPEHLVPHVEKVFDYLRMEDQIPSEPVDIGFVFGGASLESVHKAAELYWQGLYTHIGFTSYGGNHDGGNTIWGMAESERYLQEFLALGIPEDALVYPQNRYEMSTNTLEEVTLGVPFFTQRLGTFPISIALITRPIHQRRVWATMAMQFPEIHTINVPADEPPNMSDLQLSRRMVEEIERLLDYGYRKEDVVSVAIPPEVLKASASLRGELRRKGIMRTRVKISRS